MQDYTYGDKLIPQWRSWSAAHFYGDYWGNQGTLAPPFDPNAHFSSPYYDHDGKPGAGAGYWSV